MANAADALADFLEERGLPAGIGEGSDPRAQVSRLSAKGVASWEVDQEGAAYLFEVERFLNRLRADGEDLARFHGSLPRWFEGLFVFRMPDGSSEPGPRVPVPAEHIRSLRVLSRLMDAPGMTIEEAWTALDT